MIIGKEGLKTSQNTGMFKCLLDNNHNRPDTSVIVFKLPEDYRPPTDKEIDEAWEKYVSKQ